MEEINQIENTVSNNGENEIGEPIFTMGADIPVGKLLIQTRDKREFSVESVKLLQEAKFKEFYSCGMNESEHLNFMMIIMNDKKLNKHITSIFTIPTIRHTIFIEPKDEKFLSVIGEKLMARQEDTNKVVHLFINTFYLRYTYSDDHKYCHVINSVYKNDPAEIIDIDIPLERALIRVLPRLNLPELDLRVRKPQMVSTEIFKEKGIETEHELLHLTSRSNLAIDTIKYKNHNFAAGNLLLSVKIHDLQVSGDQLKPEQVDYFDMPLKFEIINSEDITPNEKLHIIIPALTGKPYKQNIDEYNETFEKTFSESSQKNEHKDESDSSDVPMPLPDPNLNDVKKLNMDTSSEDSQAGGDGEVVFFTKDDDSETDSQFEKSDNEEKSENSNKLKFAEPEAPPKLPNTFMAQTDLNVCEGRRSSIKQRWNLWCRNCSNRCSSRETKDGHRSKER